MALAAGARLANYQVLDLLGVGGMGEVYRARDTHLGRDIALKVLPAHLAENQERLDRFEREARLLASLNHPNVATLHGLEKHDGTRFLVMELVEGETLALRLARGRLGWQEALPLFEQIADGLEAAHDEGVIHRDLKPANIMITAESRVKLLDFGLAKAFAPEMREATSSHSPTVTRDGTETGVILGTAAYMSPEQARGQTVDKRTDVWAFGCCLYEALTGKPAFLRKTVADTLAGILEREPDWSAVPTQVTYVLQRTLRKNSRDRMHDIGDVRILLEDSYRLAESAGPSFRPRRWAALALIPLLGLGLWALLSDDDVAEERPVTRARLHLEEGTSLRLTATPSVAISPDGRTVAYVARDEQRARLYKRALSASTAEVVAGSEGARGPFFSPDGQWLAFHANGSFQWVPVSGGAPTSFADVPVSIGASWSPTGHIVFSRRSINGLERVHPETGETEVLIEPNRAEREKGYRLPEVLPGGQAILFTSSAIDITSFDDAKIRVLDLESGHVETLIDGGTSARYSPSGHIVYYRGGDIFAAPFDTKALRVTGPSVPVQTDVASSNFSGAEFAISRNGTLVFGPGGRANRGQRIIRIDRRGQKEPLRFDAPPAALLGSVLLSPNEELLEVELGGATDQIWIYDLVRGTAMRLTFEWDNGFAVWSPDGERLAFGSNRDGAWNLYAMSVSMSAGVERLTTSAYGQTVRSWLPDGKTLLYEESHPETGVDLWLLRLDDGLAAEPLLRTRFDENEARVSPSGDFVAYESNESGRTEVYILSLTNATSKTQVSTRGGAQPRWRRDGMEIFYWHQNALMAVDVSEREGTLALGTPVELFVDDTIRRSSYDVSSDGHFIAIDEVESEAAPSELEIVLNFAEELKRLAPPTN